MNHGLETTELICDVLVAGGGPAGVPCAIAAARCGAKVILCHDRPVLGGNASSEVRMHIVGANGVGTSERGAALATEAREGGIIEEIRLEASVRNPQRSPSMLDLILYEKCRAEPNLTLMLNTTVTAAEVSQGRISHAIAERQSTEDRFRIAARVFVDCTGDARLGVEAGATFLEGRESREHFGESLAPPTADHKRLGSSLLIMARKHDRPMPFRAPPWARQFTKHDLKLRLYATPGEEAPSLEYGFWWAEWGGQHDTIKHNEAIRDELLAVMLGIWNHIKNGPPGEAPGPWQREAENWALDWIGFLPGKRESRRLVGQYVLSESDVLESRSHDDAIAYGGWPLDLHPPEGVDAVDEPPCVQHRVPWLYDIPLRCCVSRDVANLMFAGRNISATHVAFASTRVMATCAVVGQGVGTAAAVAVERGVDPAGLASEPKAIGAIRQRLLRDDAFLIGRANDDPDDLARSAHITATSEQMGGEAWQVISGQTRSVYGPNGAPPDRANPGSHRWMNDPAAGLPAGIEITWRKEVAPREIQLVFDTGLHRHLTLSHHDGYTASMKWGRPQPETVRDYQIEALEGDTWKLVCEVKDNYLRRRVHRLDGVQSVKALRVTVLETNGIDHARICEVRVYE